MISCPGEGRGLSAQGPSGVGGAPGRRPRAGSKAARRPACGISVGLQAISVRKCTALTKVQSACGDDRRINGSIRTNPKSNNGTVHADGAQDTLKGTNLNDPARANCGPRHLPGGSVKRNARKAAAIPRA